MELLKWDFYFYNKIPFKKLCALFRCFVSQQSFAIGMEKKKAGLIYLWH